MSFENPEKKVLPHEDIETSHIETNQADSSGATPEIHNESDKGVQLEAEQAPMSAEEGLSEPDKAIQAEAEKTEKLGVLDFKAKELAREDREEADSLLLKMKDQAYSRAAGSHDALVQNEEQKREQLEHAVYGSGPEQVEHAIEDLKKAQGHTMAMERTIVKPAAESLAREKNPIAKSDPEGEGKKTMATLTSGPFAPLVGLLPASWFRRK